MKKDEHKNCKDNFIGLCVIFGFVLLVSNSVTWCESADKTKSKEYPRGFEEGASSICDSKHLSVSCHSGKCVCMECWWNNPCKVTIP